MVEIEEGLEALEKTKKDPDNETFVECMKKMEQVRGGGGTGLLLHVLFFVRLYKKKCRSRLAAKAEVHFGNETFLECMKKMEQARA